MKGLRLLTKLCAAVVLSAVCCVSFASANCTLSAEAAKIDNSASVQNVIINRDYSNLTINSSGTLTCIGETGVSSGYNAGVTVELQKFDGAWYTIKSWSDSGYKFARVNETYPADSGYSYRLKVTHNAYNSSWSLVESFTKTGSVVNYN